MIEPHAHHLFLISAAERRSRSTIGGIASRIASTTAHLKRSCTSPPVSAKLKFGSIHSVPAPDPFNTFRVGPFLDAGFQAVAGRTGQRVRYLKIKNQALALRCR